MTSEPTKAFGSNRKWLNEPILLFVEGYSDLIFYAELLEHLKVRGVFIQNLGGKGRAKLRNEVTLLLKPDNLAKMEAVAVILDADGNSDASFRIARDAIREALGLDIAEPGKWFAPQTTTRFGVFIVGGPDGTGEVESLVWDAWQSDAHNSNLKKCVDEFIDCSRKGGLKLQSLDKVRIGAVLSVLNEDDPRMGAGARAKLFNFSSAQFSALTNFFLALRPPL